MDFLLSTFKILSENNDGSSSGNGGSNNSGSADARKTTTTTATTTSNESLEASASKTKIFLRIRPTGSLAQNDNHDDIYQVEDSSTLLVKSNNPSDSARRSRPNNLIKKRFVFSKIFNSRVDQSRMFEKSIKPCALDLLANQSSTIISYGTADSGKTYTLFGTPAEPGLIPRCIEFIYSSINCATTPWFKPKQYGSVSLLNETERKREIETKEKILSSKSYDKSASEETYRELENSRVDEKNRDISEDALLHSVWLSFIEIYNDTIYDLLDVDEGGKKTQLKLAADKNGATYIQGMRSICAETGSEAYGILCAGQTRLSTVEAANYKSSRSHSIFIIKLLEYAKDSAPSEVKMTFLSFYDLAGPGRIQKPIDDEKQFRESRSINTSLLALGRCFKIISEDHSRQSVGSFRESKLTRILQHSFRSRESFFLLINLNPTAELLAETQSILNFASTAIKLTSELARDDKRLFNIHAQVSSTKIDDLPANAKIAQEQGINEIIARNEQLMTEISELKANKLKDEFEVRKELAEFYTDQINKLEENWTNKLSARKEEKDALLKFSISQLENYYKEKLEGVDRKREDIGRGDYEESFDSDVDEENKCRFLSEILALKESLGSVKNENERLNKQTDFYALEFSLLKKYLKLINQFIDEHKNLDYSLENKSFNLYTDGAEVAIDDEVSVHLSNIQEFIKKLLNLKNQSNLTSKSIQCSLDHCIVKDLLTEILQESSEINLISLPEISSDSLNNSLSIIMEEDDKNENVIDSLNKIKEIIFNANSKIIKIERENIDMSSEIESLQDKVKYQEREILQTKLQYQESESARVLLLKKLEDDKIKLNAERLFKNQDFNAVMSDNFSISEDVRLFDQESSIDDISLLESSGEKITGSSSDNSKNDSGVASSLDNVCKSEKSCQTNLISCETDGDFSFQDRLVQLKLDYKQMKAQHVQESLKVTELSQQLDRIREAMMSLSESGLIKEQTIKDYQNELCSAKLEIERLNEEKGQLEMKCERLTKDLFDAKEVYEKKLIESQTKLKIHEEGENIAAKCLGNYWEKSVNLSSELSLAYTELEKTSIRCYREHVLKIGQLEKELRERQSNENRLEMKIVEFEKDLAGMNELTKKANRLENLFEKTISEKTDLRRKLDEKLKIQSEVEEQLHRLIARVAERDGEISTLKYDFDTIIQTNLFNSKKAKELGKEVAKLMDKICAMKKDISETEESRKDVENNANKEIDTLRARLNIFKENSELLNVIFDNNESTQSEVDRLKFKLAEKQKELDFFKKNRNATIQRYENLVRQLQDALNTTGKIKKRASPPAKQKYFIDDLRKSSGCCAAHEARNRDWKYFNDEQACSLLCSNAQLTYFRAVESSDAVVNREEPTRLIRNFSEKC